MTKSKAPSKKNVLPNPHSKNIIKKQKFGILVFEGGIHVAISTRMRAYPRPGPSTVPTRSMIGEGEEPPRTVLVRKVPPMG